MAAPERFADTPDSFPLHRGRRQYNRQQILLAVHNGPHDVVACGRRPTGGLGETALRYEP